MRNLAICVMSIVLVRELHAQGMGAQIFGSVLTEEGAAASGVAVTATLMPTDEKSKVATASYTANTGASGSFAFLKLPPGKYRICAQAPTTDQLHTCLWSFRPPIINLQPEQIATR